MSDNAILDFTKSVNTIAVQIASVIGDMHLIAASSKKTSEELSEHIELEREKFKFIYNKHEEIMDELKKQNELARQISFEREIGDKEIKARQDHQDEKMIQVLNSLGSLTKDLKKSNDDLAKTLTDINHKANRGHQAFKILVTLALLTGTPLIAWIVGIIIGYFPKPYADAKPVKQVPEMPALP